MGDRLSSDSAPRSVGVFKPVGSVMIGLPNQARADALSASLQQGGWSGAAITHYVPSQTSEELEALVENAGPRAGFGYELTLLRRYLALSRQGARWLLVAVTEDAGARRAAALARAGGATLAVHYKTLTVEELL